MSMDRESPGVDLLQMMQGCNFPIQTENNTSSNDSAEAANVSCNLSQDEEMIRLLNPAEFNIMQDPIFIGIVVTLYTIVIVFGALGNILVVVTIAKTKQLWNATNVFIANLAMADILVCVFDLPLNAYYQLTDDWVFGKALCHVIPTAFAVVVYASTLSLTMIAVDRFILIVYPLKNRMTITVAILLVVVICVVSVAVASPIAIYASYSEYNDPDLNIQWRFCGEKWPHPNYSRLYTILTMALQYFVPLIVIAILYSCIFRKVRGSMQTTRSGQSSRKTKTTKMLVAVVTIFAITWTPFQIFSLLTEFIPDSVIGTYYKFGDSMLRVLAMSSSCINPILYGWLNDNYRNAFLSLIRSPAAANKVVRKEVSEFSKTPKKATAIGNSNFRVSPGMCKTNGHSKSTNTTNISEESVPLQTINNNAGGGAGNDPEDAESTQPTPQTPCLVVKEPLRPSNMSSSQSPLLKA